jgi:hypothetical protein
LHLQCRSLTQLPKLCLQGNMDALSCFNCTFDLFYISQKSAKT